MLIIHFRLFWRLRVDRLKRSINDEWINVDGKNPMRLQNVNVYVWTGPLCHHFDNEVAERSTLVENDRNDGYLTPLMTPPLHIAYTESFCVSEYYKKKRMMLFGLEHIYSVKPLLSMLRSFHFPHHI